MLDHGALDHGNITSEAQAHRHRLRHSAAVHVMADAVLKLFPEAKMGIGPPTQWGWTGFITTSRSPARLKVHPRRLGANRSPDAGSRLIGRLPIRAGRTD